MISAPPLMMQASAARPAVAGFRGASSRRGTVRCAVTAAVVAAAPAGRCTLYDVLGLRAGATGREIKAAYRRLERERHPDAAGASAAGDGGDFIRLHDAYATLSDPDARARYDRGVVAQAFARPPATRPSPPPHDIFRARPRRTWETDQCWWLPAPTKLGPL